MWKIYCSRPFPLISARVKFADVYKPSNLLLVKRFDTLFLMTLPVVRLFSKLAWTNHDVTNCIWLHGVLENQAFLAGRGREKIREVGYVRSGAWDTIFLKAFSALPPVIYFYVSFWFLLCKSVIQTAKDHRLSFFFVSWRWSYKHWIRWNTYSTKAR